MSDKERIKCKKPEAASDCMVGDEFCIYSKGLCSAQEIEATRPHDSSGSTEFTGCTAHPFDEGYEAHQAHKRHYECPYGNTAGREYAAWQAGFAHATEEYNG